MQWHIHQATIIVISPSYLDKEDLDLFARPPAASRQRAKCDGLDSVEKDGAPVETNRLQNLVLRPSANGYLQGSFRHIDVAAIPHRIRETAAGNSVEVNSQV